MTFIGVDISGDKELIRKFGKLPEAVQDAGTEFANAYIIRKMKEYQPYKYVSIQQAGGWRSEKQRRYVMAMIRNGTIKIPYRRTQGLRNRWELMGEGKNQIVVNESPIAGFVMGHGTQSRMMQMRGWKTENERLERDHDKIVQKYDAGVKKAIRRLALDG